jgi:hypothetical protein
MRTNMCIGGVAAERARPRAQQGSKADRERLPGQGPARLPMDAQWVPNVAAAGDGRAPPGECPSSGTATADGSDPVTGKRP